MSTTASPSREVVLHIGTHKTGTTAFQRYALAHREFLRDQGIAFYVHGSGAPQAHELPLLSLRPDLCIPLRVRKPDLVLEEARPMMVEAVERFVADSGDATCLFSHEALSFIRDRAEAERLRALLGGADVSVVVMLREPAAFLQSWAVQLERMGFATSSPFRSSFMNTDPDSWLVDYDTLIGVYRDVFGDDRVSVLSYEDAMARDGSSVPSLMAACGVRGDLPEGWADQRNLRSDSTAF